MSAYSDIRAALQANLPNVPGIPPADRRAYDNVVFKPPGDNTLPWVRAQFFPFRRRPTDLTARGLHRFDGTFIITIFTGADSNPIAADDLADAVVSAYDAGTILTASTDGPPVEVEFAELTDGGLYEPPWYSVPVTVKWKAFSQ